MASVYPGSLDSFSTSHVDNVNEIIHASTVNDLADAVNKIEVALGTNPVLGAADILHTVAASGASQAVNYATADVWDITLTANCTITLSGFTNAKADYLTLVLRQDGTGSRLVTWPTITWIGSGIAPILQTAASSVDSIVLFSFDGGSTVFGIAQTSASGLKSGTSFPGSPSDGDLFYRTDRRILYEYNSAATLWLSLDRKYVPLPPGDQLDSTTTAGSKNRLPLFERIYIERWVTMANIATNDGSNFWTLTLFRQSSSGVSTSIASFTTSADTAGAPTTHNVSVGVDIDPTSIDAKYLLVFTAKTGAPGSLISPSMLVVRSVG